jgi:hypothetical protein
MLIRKEGEIQASFLIYISHYSQNISTTKHGNKILQIHYLLYSYRCSFILENRNLTSYTLFPLTAKTTRMQAHIASPQQACKWVAFAMCRKESSDNKGLVSQRLIDTTSSLALA